MTLGETRNTEEIADETTSYEKLMKWSNGNSKKYSQIEEGCTSVAILEYTGEIGIASVYESVEFTRIEGTLIFE